MKVYVLYCSYYDGSDYCVIRVYENEDQANEDLEMMKKFGDKSKTYCINETEYIG